MNVDGSGVCPTELFLQLTAPVAVDRFAAGDRFDKEIPVRTAETQYHVRYSSLSVYPDSENRDALPVEEFRVCSGFANLIVNPPRFNNRWAPHPGPWPRVTAPFAHGGPGADSDACRSTGRERVAVPDGVPEYTTTNEGISRDPRSGCVCGHRVRCVLMATWVLVAIAATGLLCTRSTEGIEAASSGRPGGSGRGSTLDGPTAGVAAGYAAG